MTLTEQQLTAVKYYEGDVTGNDPFWGDAKAYVTLNSLFYPGIETERRRAAEGKRLNPAIVSDVQRLIDVCSSLVSACRAADLSQHRTAYRVERYADYQEMRQAGESISFTSTSSAGFLPAYGDRIGIALLEFHIAAGVPCLPYGELLQGDYAKAGEQEIMLPPGLPLSFEEVEVSASEALIVDAQGNPPKVKAIVKVAPPCAINKSAAAANLQSAAGERPCDIFDPEGPSAAARVYDALNSGKEPDSDDVTLYCAWKHALRTAILRAG